MSRPRSRIPWLAPLIGLFGALVAFPSCAQDVSTTPPSSGLFTYHRADTAPGGTTQIHINAAHAAHWTIQQNIFGNFLEHLGNVVYGGVWADALPNPNLEKVDDRDTEPQWWDVKGSAAWQEGGYLSPGACVCPAQMESSFSTSSCRSTASGALPGHYTPARLASKSSQCVRI